jgi:crotonobetainyl-CoA:carnitine CoA-transferase CaiB-like acyl-CoA transferase
MSAAIPKTPKPLKGVRILSLCLNLPGPAALQRLRSMGATCVKFEPPAHAGATATANVTGDPMSLYSAAGYAALQAGIRTKVVDLKTTAGQRALHKALAKTDVLMTSFRPSALLKLCLGWKALHQQHPHLSWVGIVGAPGTLADAPGHDLTYVAEHDLVTGLDLPATLYADMGGALMASEAVLQAVLLQRQLGKGGSFEVALSDAAAHLALPRQWGATLPGTVLGGAHAGYRVYPCKNGRVAVAALEPHFAKSLCAVTGLTWTGPSTMLATSTHQAIAQFVADKTRLALEKLSVAHDIPLHTLSK